jgi:hypothetical protein
MDEETVGGLIVSLGFLIVIVFLISWFLLLVKNVENLGYKLDNISLQLEAIAENSQINKETRTKEEKNRERQRIADLILDPQERQYFLNHPELSLSDLENVSVGFDIFGIPFTKRNTKNFKLNKMNQHAMRKKQELSQNTNPSMMPDISRNEMIEILSNYFNRPDEKVALESLTDQQLRKLYARKILK